MLIHTVTFETTLSETETMAVATSRADAYRAVPGLIQKFYVKLGAPNSYRGVMLWKDAESLAAFRDTDLAKTVPQAYGVVGTPEVSIGENLMLLHETDALIPA